MIDILSDLEKILETKEKYPVPILLEIRMTADDFREVYKQTLTWKSKADYFLPLKGRMDTTFNGVNICLHPEAKPGKLEYIFMEPLTIPSEEIDGEVSL